MAKRKRPMSAASPDIAEKQGRKKSKETTGAESSQTAAVSVSETIQIVAGSYDQVLHGLTAVVEPEREAQFADTFLFTAHQSAIRCVAVSPPSAPEPGQTQKVVLASGSTDERINLYSLSAHPPSRKHQEALSSVAPRPVLENAENREIGTLLHHGSTVTALRFPTRSKLLSSSEDSTIAVTRTRDWSTLSTIKAPIPKAQGRPSGDTAALGTTPSGVNDFAIHPSMKLMISVSRGERCMRLWNLVTGKKAGVLNFDRQMLHEVGEGRHSLGEGRRVAWGAVDGTEEFAVSFDRDVVVFGMDSVPRCRVMPASRRTKVHQMVYVSVDEKAGSSLLALSTEDGRIVFFSTREDEMTTATEEDGGKGRNMGTAAEIGHVGGRGAGVTGRIKDFVVLRSEQWREKLYVVGAGSDGTVRVWAVGVDELKDAWEETKREKAREGGSKAALGTLVGKYETHNRITCLAAFMMIPRLEGAEESDGQDDEASTEADEGSGGMSSESSEASEDEEE